MAAAKEAARKAEVEARYRAALAKEHAAQLRYRIEAQKAGVTPPPLFEQGPITRLQQSAGIDTSAIQQEAKRVNAEWWKQQQGKSVDEIMELLKKPGGAVPTRLEASGVLPRGAGWVPDTRAADNAKFLEGLQSRAALHDDILQQQFGRKLPIREAYGIHGSNFEPPPEVLSAYMNPHQTGALAQEMARLEGMYPGTMSRLRGLETGRSSAEAWITNRHHWPETPGAVPYEIGFPSNPALSRMVDPSKVSDLTPGMRDQMLSSADKQHWAAQGPDIYPSSFNATATHELGHAVHYSLLDWMKDPKNYNKLSAEQIERISNQLANDDAAYLGKYANQMRGLTTTKAGAMAEIRSGHPGASAEPFAELFSVARSEPGVEYAAGKTTPAVIKALVGPTRSEQQGMKLLDRVSQLNKVEKMARGEGWGEVAKASPNLLAGLAAPIALGLAANKTHGHVRDALGGAATGAGIGAMYGLPGIGLGALGGAGIGLAKSLLF